MARFTRKKILKFTCFFIGTKIILLVIFHFLFVHYSGRLLQSLIEYESKGRFKAVIKSFDFSYWHRTIDIKDLYLYSADSSIGSTAYHFKSESLSLRLKAIWPILRSKKIDIDSIICNRPSVEVYTSDNINPTKKHHNPLTKEIGEMYVSIQHVLNRLHIKRFEINDGRVSIKDRVAGGDPLSLSNIYFHVDNLNIDSTQLEASHFYLATILFSKPPNRI